MRNHPFAMVGCAAVALAGTALAAEPAPTRHFEDLRYFILDDAWQHGAQRSHAYVRLIGYPEAFHVFLHYDGGASHLAATRHRRRLVVYLKRQGTIVGRIIVADLTTAHGAVRIDAQRHVSITTAFWNIDEVDAQIEH